MHWATCCICDIESLVFVVRVFIALMLRACIVLWLLYSCRKCIFETIEFLKRTIQETKNIVIGQTCQTTAIPVCEGCCKWDAENTILNT